MTGVAPSSASAIKVLIRPGTRCCCPTRVGRFGGLMRRQGRRSSTIPSNGACQDGGHDAILEPCSPIKVVGQQPLQSRGQMS